MSENKDWIPKVAGAVAVAAALYAAYSYATGNEEKKIKVSKKQSPRPQPSQIIREPEAPKVPKAEKVAQEELMQRLMTLEAEKIKQRAQTEEENQVEEILVEEAFKWAHFMGMDLDAEAMKEQMAAWVRKALKATLQTQVGDKFQCSSKLTEEVFHQLIKICECNKHAYFLQDNLKEIENRTAHLPESGLDNKLYWAKLIKQANYLIENEEDADNMVLGQIKDFTPNAWEFAKEEFIGDSSAENIDPSFVKNMLQVYNSNPFEAEADASLQVDFDSQLELVVSTIEKIWKGFTFNTIETFIKVIDLACLDQAMKSGFKSEAQYRMAKKDLAVSEKAEECHKRLATLIDTICSAEPVEEGEEEQEQQEDQNEPEKVTAEPEQVIAEPEQVTAEPEQVTNEPEQATNEPEQITSSVADSGAEILPQTTEEKTE